MKKYPFEKYRFVISEDKRQMIAITHDAGETIKASATCDPSDKFDIEYGKKLAASRANYKVALRRRKRSEKAVAKAIQELSLAQERVKRAMDFDEDAGNALYDAIIELGKYDD